MSLKHIIQIYTVSLSRCTVKSYKIFKNKVLYHTLRYTQ